MVTEFNKFEDSDELHIPSSNLKSPIQIIPLNLQIKFDLAVDSSAT